MIQFESIGNPAGIGQGTGLGLREQDRDGIGLGLSRLRASIVTLWYLFERLNLPPQKQERMEG